MGKSISVCLEFPEDALSVLRKSPQDFAREMKLAAVCKWYELGLLSQAKAAQVAGLSRRAFLDLLSSYGVSPFQTTAEELREELERG
jgi:predicted HTH domain antitoxin